MQLKCGGILKQNLIYSLLTLCKYVIQTFLGITINSLKANGARNMKL